MASPFPQRAIVAASLAVAATALAAAPPPLPGPAPQVRAAAFEAAAENAACEGCHPAIAAEWRSSLHHRAWDDPVFQGAYSIEPLAFCRGCHAPEADPARLPAEGARRLGVGCVTCHVQGADIVGPRARAAGGGVHAVRADARLATEEACARCHQFDFPRPQRAPMQGTGDEHRASAHAGQACQACHMPPARDGGRGHRSHDFRVIGDAAKLRSAVTARAARDGDRAVTVALAAARVGHAFPTGDMFRRLEVRARAVDEQGEVMATAGPVVLARRFVVARGEHGSERVQVGDDRVPANGAAREVRLAFAEPVAGRAVRWEVAYQRLDASMAAAFGVDPRADEIIVAEGTLPPERTRR
ncbi:MAG: multiheme c-type cytochrome [Minicystis sp.]